MSNLSEFGIGESPENGYICGVCDKHFETKSSIHGHINSKRLEGHPDWSELPVSRNDMSSWEV